MYFRERLGCFMSFGAMVTQPTRSPFRADRKVAADSKSPDYLGTVSCDSPRCTRATARFSLGLLFVEACAGQRLSPAAGAHLRGVALLLDEVEDVLEDAVQPREGPLDALACRRCVEPTN